MKRLSNPENQSPKSAEAEDLRHISGIITSVRILLQRKRKKFLGNTVSLDDLLLMYDLRDSSQLEKYLDLSEKRGIVWEKTKTGDFKLTALPDEIIYKSNYSEEEGQKDLNTLKIKLSLDEPFKVEDVALALNKTPAVAIKIIEYLVRFGYIELISPKNQTRVYKFSPITPVAKNGEIPKNPAREPK